MAFPPGHLPGGAAHDFLLRGVSVRPYEWSFECDSPACKTNIALAGIRLFFLAVLTFAAPATMHPAAGR
jgi:hypothetical protein